MDNELKTEEAVSENAVPTGEAVSTNTVSAEDTVVTNGDGEAKSEKKSESKESLESILRRFKRQSSGIVAEIKKREAYDKPSVKRKKKSKEARRKRAGKFGFNKW